MKMNNIKMIVAAYARYSTDLQTDNSIAYQFAAIEKYCESNNLVIVDKFADEAMTGTNINRPDFLKMRENALQRKYDAIVIYDITRLNRNVGDWMEFHQAMTDIGVKILSPTMEIGSFYNPNSFLIGGMNALIGEHFVLVTREKTIAGLKERAKSAKFNGGVPPYGYDVDNKGNYVINEDEAVIVRKIFEMYTSGNSYSEIIETANNMGYIGRRGKPLSPGSLVAILRNDKYVGTYIYNKYQCRVMTKRLTLPIQHKDDDIIKIDNSIPAIISKSMWEVSKQRLARRMAKFSTNAIYPLKGLIYCGVCNSQYRGEHNVNSKGCGGRYYRCGGKRDKKISCCNIGIRADKIEGFVEDAIKKQFFNNNSIEKMVDATLQEINNITANLDNSNSFVKKEIADIDMKLNNITKAIESGIIYDGLAKKVNLLNNRKTELMQKTQELKQSSDVFTRQSIAKKMSEVYDNLSNSDMNKHYIGVRNVIDKIVVQPTGEVLIYVKKAAGYIYSEKRIRTADLSGMNRTL